jgi:hypothetical protein
VLRNFILMRRPFSLAEPELFHRRERRGKGEIKVLSGI